MSAIVRALKNDETFSDSERLTLEQVKSLVPGDEIAWVNIHLRIYVPYIVREVACDRIYVNPKFYNGSWSNQSDNLFFTDMALIPYNGGIVNKVNFLVMNTRQSVDPE